MQNNNDSLKMRIMTELAGHIGALHAIGMAELHQIVTGETWANRINDTRRLRTLISELRFDGVPICSAPKRNGGGYYLASASSEMTGFLRNRESLALKILAMNAKIRKLSLPEYLGQMKLNMDK
jgi:hypothetical protein